jgi:hypothetical protein
MVLRWLVGALAIGAVLPAGAMALERGVILDRGPVAKEYSLPLDAQRVDLSGLSQSIRHADAVRAGIAAPQSSVAPGPLFGFGVLTPAERRALEKSITRARLAGRGLVAAALPAGERQALLTSGRLAAQVPEGGLLGGGSGVAAALVLIGGALGGWLLRRLRLI